MANRPVGKNELAQEKKDIAGRARRLAQTLSQDADRALLTHYADELEREAEALQRLTPAVSLPPVGASNEQVQHQQVQQQQSIESSNPSNVPKEKA